MPGEHYTAKIDQECFDLGIREDSLRRSGDKEAYKKFMKEEYNPKMEIAKKLYLGED